MVFTAEVRTPVAPDAGTAAVEAVLEELIARGVDLRTVSLDEMKRRLAVVLRTWSTTSAVASGRTAAARPPRLE